MFQTLTLGRIHDIDVKIHPTLGLVLVWVFFDFGSGGVGIAGGPQAVFFGLVLVALVFACVLLHELGHSFMAMHYGFRVHDVTLSVIGGVARIEHMPTRPSAEMLIALAGPAVNVAILVALAPVVLLYGLVQGFDSPGDYLQQLTHMSVGSLLLALGWANLLILLFNLLPAFPLDGGRVLRAGLTTFVGRERGTRIAVLLGQVMAAALAVFGVWIHQWSLPLIAIFVAVVAQSEGRVVRLEAAMRRLQVGQFALWDMGGIAPNQPLTYALRGGPRDVAVTDQGRVVGMLWRHHLLTELHGGAGGRTVADIMDSSATTADAHESVYDVQERMNRLKQWAVPIVEDGQYRGIFTADRFVHVYRQLVPFTPRLPRMNGIASAISRALRSRAR